MPTEENIDRICQDLRNQLYESYFLNFISAISRSKLEDVASAALAANAVAQVTKVSAAIATEGFVIARSITSREDALRRDRERGDLFSDTPPFLGDAAPIHRPGLRRQQPAITPTPGLMDGRRRPDSPGKERKFTRADGVRGHASGVLAERRSLSLSLRYDFFFF
ncbi:Sec1 family domain-containing protein 1 [Liparis tanakae]|uniref:Sec1 family domain-containing protein 1 n=1 Tax=Liparis tanakae TaxID=230148 RepID=A0A4Z2H5F8_9TELE|nr:Sec1 family domain-containing protein 1 [Liparis tanakae]